MFLAAVRKNTFQEVILGKKVNAYHCTIILTLDWAEELIVPPAGLPNLGLIKKHNAKYWHYQEELPKRCSSSELLGATEVVYLL